jgi:hypothetical protein
MSKKLRAEYEQLVQEIQRIAIAGRGYIGKDGLDALLERKQEIENELDGNVKMTFSEWKAAIDVNYLDEGDAQLMENLTGTCPNEETDEMLRKEYERYLQEDETMT